MFAFITPNLNRHNERLADSAWNVTTANLIASTAMDVSGTSERRYSSRLMLAAQLTAFVVAALIVGSVELPRLATLSESQNKFADWLAGFNLDTTFYALLLLIAPFVWRFRSFREVRQSAGWLNSIREALSETATTSNGDANPSGRTAWLLAGIVGLASLGVSIGVAFYKVDPQRELRFGDLPPAYHDEYSYLFQANTFLAGRFSFPSHASMPELFDQFHLLNDNGQFASRYFPGVGAWIAPFLAIGHPYWGHWLAGAVCAMFVFWTGRELGNNGVGFLAGMLCALSLGMGQFSNLLLSHHPTLAGLSLFLFAFVRMQRTHANLDAVLAGIGLTFAMLCRPMTAAGFGLPFGIWFASFLFRNKFNLVAAARMKLVGGLAIPLALGFIVLFIQNRAITGDALKFPYQLYTEIYTPRHVYGFDNVEWGEKHLGPKVIEKYDTWAENLTSSLAAQNVRDRLIASLQWTLGIIPLTMAIIVFVVSGNRLGPRWWLVFASIVSLHVVHIPYWFAGIDKWHYVFETGPLLCLIFAASTQLLLTSWQDERRGFMGKWWGLTVAASLVVTYTSLEPLWIHSRLASGIHQTSFSRLKYWSFQRKIEKLGDQRALILIQHDPADIHIDYVINEPGLDSQILYGRFDPSGNIARDRQRLQRIVTEFSDRSIYLYKAATQNLVAVRF